jgi:hypothetical protein
MNRRPALAGVFFGLLTVKPTMGLLVCVALLAARAWRTAAVAVFVSIALVAASSLAYGLTPWLLFLNRPMVVADIMTGDHPLPVQLMASVLPRFFVAFGTGAFLVQFVSTVAGCFVVYRVFRSSTDAATRALAVAVGTCVATPYLFVYDLPMLTLSLALYVQSRRIRAVEAPLLIGLWFLPAFAVFGPLWLPLLISAAALTQLWHQAEAKRAPERPSRDSSAPLGSMVALNDAPRLR